MGMELWSGGVAADKGAWQEREGKNSGVTEVQLSVLGSGSVSVTGYVYGSNDGVGEILLGDLTVTGTASPTVPLSVSDTITRPYRYLRFDLSPVTGSVSRVTVTQAGV
ncbi:hypothetical protein [Chitinolyticbacter meiyuanensis]|uniref:hypothetical protein n=1 Tax=Chitinolyticbacter meiyuanensis TaxID=682798 RepID=UPI0011E58E57|nr:hypothetical protein [Chitinolyticbacter meiyuanensis]